MQEAKQQVKCSCGRSPTEFCVGLHNFTNEEYKKFLEQREKLLSEQTKPQFLVD